MIMKSFFKIIISILMIINSVSGVAIAEGRRLRTEDVASINAAPQINSAVNSAQLNGNQSNSVGGDQNTNNVTQTLHNSLVGESKSITCSLVEGENKDVLDALDNLRVALREVSRKEECKDDTNIHEMIEQQQNMQNSASSVMSIWDDKEAMAENLGGFSTDVQTLLNGVNSITNSLNNNSLMNSKCSEQLLSSGKVLVAVSDLVTSMAPFAMFVAVNSKMSVAVPWVIGVVGVASVIKFIGDRAKNNNKLDIEHNPEHQKLVLKATCEFSRVATKIRFLKLAQTGKLEEISNELNKTEGFQPMSNELSQDLQKLIRIRNNFYDKLNSIKADYEEQKKSLADVKNNVTEKSSNTFICSLGQQLGEQYNKKKFPYNVFQTMEKVNNLGDSSTDIVGDSSDELKKAFALGINSTLKKQLTSEKVEECASATKELIGSIEDALTFTFKEIKLQKKSIEEKLSKNEEYRIWYSQNKDLEQEKEVVGKITQAMQSVVNARSAVERSLIDQRLEELRSILFGDYDESLWGKYVNPSEPPVYLWLKYTLDLYESSIKGFNKSFENLKNELADLSVGRGRSKYSDMRYQSVVAYFLKLHEYQKEVKMSKMKGTQNLDFINAKEFPEGSEKRTRVCSYLETLWLDYSTSMNHFESAKSFCKSINEHINYKTSQQIKNICGSNSLNGLADVNSKIYQFERAMALSGMKDKKYLLSDKMNELKCFKGLR